MSYLPRGPGAPYLLRSWTSNDAGSDREISQAIYPEYREESGHPAWFPAQQLGAPRECSSRYVVVETRNDQLVAYASLWELRPKRYRFDLAVRPEWQGQGLATQLLSQVINDAQALGATGLQARVRDDKTEALAFVRRRGFVESHRMAAYRLDIAPGLFDSPERAGAELRDSGLEVTNLADLLKRDADSVERLYELYSAAREGWPDPDPDPNGPVSLPLERFKGWLDQLRQPEAVLIAMHQARYVAFTSFFDIGTAVHPEYRCKGIATLLKSLSIADAHERGLRGQTTSTASPAMARVLEKLGYRRSWSEVRLLRELVP
ncbi:MAG TPA: GNAT family N-acetyltransferase [Candidatus Angelobacter sp.]